MSTKARPTVPYIVRRVQAMRRMLGKPCAFYVRPGPSGWSIRPVLPTASDRKDMGAFRARHEGAPWCLGVFEDVPGRADVERAARLLFEKARTPEYAAAAEIYREFRRRELRTSHLVFAWKDADGNVTLMTRRERDAAQVDYQEKTFIGVVTPETTIEDIMAMIDGGLESEEDAPLDIARAVSIAAP